MYKGTATTHGLLTQKGLPSTTAFTAVGIGVLRTDRNDYSCLLALEDGLVSAALTLNLCTNSDGTSLAAYSPATGFSSTVGTLTVGVPFWWSMVLNGTGGSGITIAFREYGSPAVSRVTHTGASFTPTVLFLGNDSYAEAFFGELSHVRIWNRALSQAEVDREMYSAVALCRDSSLIRESPLHGTSLAEMLRDYGPQKVDWAFQGAPSVAVPPPVPGAMPYRPRRLWWDLDVSGGGGGPFSADATDSVTAGDGAGVTLVVSASAADAAASSDASTAQASSPAAAADAVAAADAAAQTPVLSRSSTDAASAADAATTAMAVAVAAADNVSPADAGSAAAIDAVGASDSVTPTDAAAQVTALPAAAADAVSATDAGTQTPVLSRAATDAVSTADAASETPVMNASASDAAAATDAASRAMTVAVSAADAASPADVASAAYATNVAAADAVSAADTASQLAVFARAASDGINAADAATITVVLAALAADDIDVLDAAVLLAGIFGLSATDMVSLIDAATASMGVAADLMPAAERTLVLAARIRRMAVERNRTWVVPKGLRQYTPE